ncbi:MAG TPA: hypothetical protein VF449_04215 [Parvibaculum sp.]
MKTTQKSFRMKAAALALAGVATVALPVAPAFADGWHHDGGGYGGGGWHNSPQHWNGGGYRGYRGHDDHDDGAGIAIAAGAVGLLLGAAIASQPAYYTPPPQTVYAPAPSGYYDQQPLQAQPASDVYRTESGQYCREYQSTVRIDGRLQSSYGTACLQPDGAWRVVN